jgi:hypothetical protein
MFNKLKKDKKLLLKIGIVANILNVGGESGNPSSSIFQINRKKLGS